MAHKQSGLIYGSHSGADARRHALNIALVPSGNPICPALDPVYCLARFFHVLRGPQQWIDKRSLPCACARDLSAAGPAAPAQPCLFTYFQLFCFIFYNYFLLFSFFFIFIFVLFIINLIITIILQKYIT